MRKMTLTDLCVVLAFSGGLGIGCLIGTDAIAGAKPWGRQDVSGGAYSYEPRSTDALEELVIEFKAFRQDFKGFRADAKAKIPDCQSLGSVTGVDLGPKQ